MEPLSNGRRYIRLDDLKAAAVFEVIADVVVDNVRSAWREEELYVLVFRDDRRVTLRERNRARLVEAWGDESEAWIGRTVRISREVEGQRVYKRIDAWEEKR